MTIKELKELAEETYVASEYAKNGKDNLDLLNCHINSLNNLINDGRIHFIHPDLTKVEVLCVFLLQGRGCTLIQTSAYCNSKSNPLTEILIKNLDSALLKTPKFTGKILYRNVSYHEGYNIELGQIITVRGFFTTSKDDLDNAKIIKWVITPLSPEKTKAREIYKIYDQAENCPYPEYQVEFERNTSFKITDIKKCEPYDIVYVAELSNQ